jgi:diacylglycerol kinase
VNPLVFTQATLKLRRAKDAGAEAVLTHEEVVELCDVLVMLSHNVTDEPR